MMIAASTVLVVFSYVIFRSFRSVEQSVIATITDSRDAIWSDESDGLLASDEIGVGILRLESGAAKLEYRHGVVLSLVGPAEFEIFSQDRGALRYGEMAAYVPDGAEGFRVETPTAGVTDLGTEFGVSVNAQGQTSLSVFDGKVELSSSSDSEIEIVSAGQSYGIDDQGKRERLSKLLPYKEARDSLRGWQIIWEPFGPGSTTGEFPGSAGAGWQGAWVVDHKGGIAKKGSFVSDRQPLHDGAEYYLTIASQSENENTNAGAILSREFGEIDQFTTSEPYTIEMLVRIECEPDTLERLRIFSQPVSADSDDPATWQLDVNRRSSDDELAWHVPSRATGKLVDQTLAVGWWETVRFFVEVSPTQDYWRATVANNKNSISSGRQDAMSLNGVANGPMRICFEAVGKKGTPIRFSIDGIRIQNRPRNDKN